MMDEYERTIAKAESAWIGYEDHGILTVHVGMQLGKGSHQGIPGYALDQWNEDEQRRVGGPQSIEFIAALMAAFGVDRFDKIVGRTVFVLHALGESGYGGGLIKGIEPLPTEKGERVIFADVWEKVPA